MRKRIYIAGPITLHTPDGPNWHARYEEALRNVSQADEAMFALMKAGFAPFNPKGEVKATYHEMPNGTNLEDWMGTDLPWVEVSAAVLRLPGESKGADKEVDFALENRIPVFYSLLELLAHFAE